MPACLIAAVISSLLMPGQLAPADRPPEPTAAPVARTVAPVAARDQMPTPVSSASPAPFLSPSPALPRPYSGRPSAPPPAASIRTRASSVHPVEIGLKGGLSMAGIRGDGTDDWDNRNGVAGGGFVFIPLSDYFGLQAELLYVSKGAEHEENWNGENLKTTLNLAYLEIPVLARLTIPTGSRLTPSIFAGPVLGLKVKGDQEAEYRGHSTSEEIEGLKSTDFGLALGGGLDVDTGYGKALIDLRYEIGLTKILEEEGSVKNGAFLIMAGYSFNFWPF